MARPPGIARVVHFLAASKAGMLGLTKALAKEVEDDPTRRVATGQFQASLTREFPAGRAKLEASQVAINRTTITIVLVVEVHRP